MLHADIAGAGPRLVLVHGFTQNRRCWGGVLPRLQEHYEVVAVDAPGHGRSDQGDDDLWTGARRIGEVGGTASYLGYSMGGRFCLHLALDQPERVTRLVLVSATAGLESTAERAARIDADDKLAADLERDGLETFLDRWLDLPLFAGIPPERTSRSARLENSVAGLAASLRHAGTGTQDDLWPRLAELNMPVLVVAGADDVKFAPIAERMASAIGENATLTMIPGSGHTPHLERPDEFVAVVARWLS